MYKRQASGWYSGGEYVSGCAIRAAAQAPAAARIVDVTVPRAAFAEGGKYIPGANTHHRDFKRYAPAPHVNVARPLPPPPPPEARQADGFPQTMQAGRHASCRKERGSGGGGYGGGGGGCAIPTRAAWYGVRPSYSLQQAGFEGDGGRRYGTTAVAPPPQRYWVCLLYTSPSPRD